MKSGLGSASVRIGDTGLIVGALAAVNAVGDVIDHRTGSILAGARTPDGKEFADSMAQIMNGYTVKATEGANTTLAVVATNASFDKTQMTKIAQMAQDGLARAIRPVHTSSDGDTVFAAATGTSSVKAQHGMIGAIAAEVLAEAIARAVRAATGIPGYPAWRDVQSK
jgi:L-aminopeptidase/D-esterase-like protein